MEDQARQPDDVDDDDPAAPSSQHLPEVETSRQHRPHTETELTEGADQNQAACIRGTGSWVPEATVARLFGHTETDLANFIADQCCMGGENSDIMSSWTKRALVAFIVDRNLLEVAEGF